MRLEELGQGADGQIMALGKLIAAADAEVALRRELVIIDPATPNGTLPSVSNSGARSATTRQSQST